MAYIDERAAHYNRGKPIPSWEPYPRVDWSKINPHTKRNLPQPSELPISGCPQDPNIYPDAPNPEGRIMECYRPTTECSLPGCMHKECNPPADSTTTIHPHEAHSGWLKAISRNKEGKILLSKIYQPLNKPHRAPFGKAAGFPTNLGVVAVPTCPVGGYVYTEEGWILHATTPG